MTPAFKVGDEVRLVGLDGLTHLNYFQRPVPNTVYTVAETTLEFSSDALLIRLVQHRGWWRAANFDLYKPKSPARAEDTATIQNLQREVAYYRDLLTPLARSDNNSKEHPLGTLSRILAEHKRLDRQMFLANSYNWNRSGLTWETAARNLFNYVQVALGKPELPTSAPLLPSLVGKDAFAKGGTAEEKDTVDLNASNQKTFSYLNIPAQYYIKGGASKDAALNVYPPESRPGTYDIRFEGVRVADRPINSMRTGHWCETCKKYHGVHLPPLGSNR